MAEKQTNSNFNNQLNYTRDYISESFNRLFAEVEKKRQHLLQQLDELEEDYKLISTPAQGALANLVKLKEQVDESIRVNDLVQFREKQLTEINTKMQELNRSMEIEIKLCFKDYVIDSLAQILDQIKLDVVVSDTECQKSSSNYFASCENLLSPTLYTPSIGSQPKPCITTCCKGSKHGELNNPRGVAVCDSTNQIYVADYGNNRVQVFDYEGAFVSNFTDHIHKTDRPYGLALHGNSLFMTMEGTHTVQKFTLQGKLVKKIGGKGSDIKKFKSPFGIIVSTDNTVFVCDYGNNRLQLFTTGLKYSDTLGTGQLDGPLDVKTKENGHILVLDSGIACLHVFNRGGELIQSMLTRGVISQLSNPWFFDIGCNGVIMMTDSSKSVINIFTAEGDLVNTLEGNVGGAEFVFPTGIAIRGGNKPVCVFNKRNALLQLF